MKTLKCTALAVFIAASFSANAQTLNPVNDKPFIEVTGVAEIEVSPDEITVDIIISERYDGREKLTIEQQEQKLVAALEQIGIDLKKLSLSAANAEYVKIKKSTRDVLTSKQFKVKLSAAGKVAALFEQLDKIDVGRAYVSMMGHSKMDSLKKETRINAVKAAKNKAEYLLQAIGSTAGKPVMVQEKGYETENLYAANTSYKYKSEPGLSDNDSYGKKDDDIQLRMIKVRSEIQARFLIQ